MSIQVQCEQCKRRDAVPDKTAGRKITCPQCKAVIEVPELLEELEPTAEPLGVPMVPAVCSAEEATGLDDAVLGAGKGRALATGDRAARRARLQEVFLQSKASKGR